MDVYKQELKIKAEKEGNNFWLAFRCNKTLAEQIKIYQKDHNLEGLSTAIRELLFKQLFEVTNE